MTELGFHSAAVKDTPSSKNEAYDSMKGNANSKIYQVLGGRNYDAPMKNVVYLKRLRKQGIGLRRKKTK